MTINNSYIHQFSSPVDQQNIYFVDVMCPNRFHSIVFYAWMINSGVFAFEYEKKHGTSGEYWLANKDFFDHSPIHRNNQATIERFIYLIEKYLLVKVANYYAINRKD